MSKKEKSAGPARRGWVSWLILGCGAALAAAILAVWATCGLGLHPARLALSARVPEPPAAPQPAPLPSPLPGRPG